MPGYHFIQTILFLYLNAAAYFEPRHMKIRFQVEYKHEMLRI